MALFLVVTDEAQKCVVYNWAQLIRIDSLRLKKEAVSRIGTCATGAKGIVNFFYRFQVIKYFKKSKSETIQNEKHH